MNATDESDIPDFAQGQLQYYDPTAPVIRWHQTMELCFICIFNAISVILVLARCIIKYRRLGKLKGDDYWIVAAGFLLIAPLWICQIATNMYGNGMRTENVPYDWYPPWFAWSTGWLAYHVIVSFIKVGICAALLQIMPKANFKNLRLFVYGLCAAILVLGFLCFFLLLFPCTPLNSNWDIIVPYDKCYISLDSLRYSWSAISMCFDLVICYLPFRIMQKIQIGPAARRILALMSFSTFLGLVACGMGIYGEYLYSGNSADSDIYWDATPWVICNDAEILGYQISAFLPLLSTYLVPKKGGVSTAKSFEQSTLVSKARNIMNREPIKAPKQKMEDVGRGDRLKVSEDTLRSADNV